MTTIKVNGNTLDVNAEMDTPILWVLRDHLGLTGTKYGCGMALCGACTVHIDGKAARACQVPLSAVGTQEVTTIEGAELSEVGKKVQAAWQSIDVAQCGYCQPGQIMSAIALIKSNPRPSVKDIDDAMSGNLCRCGTYTRIRAAIQKAAGGKGNI
jgi:isoquinoline 1-oxidoreductase alpha subunit